MNKQTTDAPPVGNLYQKLAAISANLGAIEKDGQYDGGQRGGSYKFISHGALMAHLRGELSRANIVILPSMRDSRTEAREKHSEYQGQARVSMERRVVVTIDFTIINGDDPAEREVLRWSGEGIDAGDKATQKAATSAEKYLLLKLFKVSDKDDPDAENPAVEEVRPRQAPASTRAVEAETQGLPEAAAGGTASGRSGVNGSSPQQQILRALASIPAITDRTKWCTDNGITYSKTAILDLPTDRAEVLLASLVVAP